MRALAGLLAALALTPAPLASAQEPPPEQDPMLEIPPAEPLPPLPPVVGPPPPVAPPPPAPPVRYEQKRPNTRMVTSGLLAFAGLYVGTILVAIQSGKAQIAIPIGGAIWGGVTGFDENSRINCGADSSCSLTKTFNMVSAGILVLEGVLQGAALGVAIAGLFLTRKVPIQAALAPSPGGATLAIGGTF